MGVPKGDIVIIIGVEIKATFENLFQTSISKVAPLLPMNKTGDYEESMTTATPIRNTSFG